MQKLLIFQKWTVDREIDRKKRRSKEDAESKKTLKSLSLSREIEASTIRSSDRQKKTADVTSAYESVNEYLSS